MMGLSKEKFDKLQKSSVKCICGHTIIAFNKSGYVLCNWCSRKVYINKKVEFKEKLLKEIKKRKEAK